jgi:hypothetical protein
MPASLSVAANLPLDRRKHLAIQALARTEPLSRVAARERVSRKFLYHQKRKANEALDQAFAPTQPGPAVLFHLPVTTAWLNQPILGLVLICHSSYRVVLR